MIIDYILGNIESLPDSLKNEVNAFYFASCLLVPSEVLKKIVDSLGGYDVVLSDYNKINQISNIFYVPYKIAKMRLIKTRKDKKEVKTLDKKNKH